MFVFHIIFRSIFSAASPSIHVMPKYGLSSPVAVAVVGVISLALSIGMFTNFTLVNKSTYLTSGTVIPCGNIFYLVVHNTCVVMFLTVFRFW